MLTLGSFHSVPSLIVFSAMGYALSAVGMKSISVGALSAGIAALVIGLSVAVWAEVLLLRQTDLSTVYLTIIAAETLLVLAYAASIGDVLTLRQGAGAVLVFVGLLAISTGPAGH